MSPIPFVIAKDCHRYRLVLFDVGTTVLCLLSRHEIHFGCLTFMSLSLHDIYTLLVVFTLSSFGNYMLSKENQICFF